MIDSYLILYSNEEKIRMLVAQIKTEVQIILDVRWADGQFFERVAKIVCLFYHKDVVEIECQIYKDSCT